MGSRRRVISIDPGVHQTGIAVWDGGQLIAALLTPTDELLPLSDANVIVVELPQVYVRARSKGDPNDLINVAFAAGKVVGSLRSDETTVTTVKPAAWKGQVPKHIIEARVKKALSATELDNVVQCKPNLMHNVWDAVGIGLAYMGRL